MRRVVMLLASSVTLAKSGCEAKPAAQIMPEVNDENCKSENIAKILDKPTQQEFAGKCVRRGEFKPSPTKEW